jgi:hypothetical protein
MAGYNFQISKLLVVCIVFAAAATSALVIQMVTGMPGHSPGPGPNGQPPPPPEMQPLAVFSIVTGFFVLAWLSVLVVFCRDQILLRLRATPAAEHADLEKLLSTLRAELAADRERELQSLDERLAEYGERRETDGYLSGMRVATSDPVEAKVRALRPLPPQR